jgi:hypothetical protein
MTIREKQLYEAHFNNIGHFLINAYEKADKNKRSKISPLIINLNQMYMYTNKLETRLIKQKLNKMLVK